MAEVVAKVTTTGDGSQVAVWIKELETLYGERKRADFDKERLLLEQYLGALTKQLSGKYELIRPLAVGGTGVIFVAKQMSVPRELVVKFNRPLQTEECTMVKNESEILPLLNHPNIILLLDRGEIAELKPALTYVVEPLLAKANDLQKFVQLKLKDVQKDILTEPPAPQKSVAPGVRQVEDLLSRLCLLFPQWVAALDHLHSKGFVYLDVKPENVLVDDYERLVMIDFGSAQKLDSSDSNSILVFYTERYAHPFLKERIQHHTSSNRVRGGVQRKELNVRWDYYALGQSILETLNRIAEVRPNDCPNLATFRALHFMATRLLDGQNKSKAGALTQKRVAGETFGDFLPTDYQDLAYTRLEDTLRDLEKETGKWNPEFVVRELSSFSNEVVRVVPGFNTVLTPRLRSLIEHPLFARLKTVTQLGLISLVYPTADHARYDHALGTYTYTTLFLKSLFNDTKNPVFRNLVDESDIKACLLASLLHDLGQYPLAHDLEEVHPEVFSHVKLTYTLLDSSRRDAHGKTLSDLISDPVLGWGVDPEKVKRVLGAHSSRMRLDLVPAAHDFKVDLLSALIDGPVDADKADYLIRDSNRCELSYGAQLDIERLLRVLTVAVLPHASTSAKHRVTVGVYAKGLTSARAFGLARYELLSTVYWHHTSRIIKAMIQYSAAINLPKETMADDPKRIQEMRQQLLEFVTMLAPPTDSLALLEKKQKAAPKTKLAIAADASKDVMQAMDEASIGASTDSGAQNWYPGIARTDWLMLLWIRNLPSGSLDGKNLVDSLTSRKLYKRIATFSRRGPQAKLIDRASALSWSKRVDLCRRLSEKLKNALSENWNNLDTITPLSIQEVERIFETSLAVIIDMPKPNEKIGFSRDLVAVPELKSKTYFQEGEGPIPDTEWAATLSSMLQDSAPLRVLCHPDLHQAISASVRPIHDKLANALEETLNEM